jgi:hypothetical protein
MLIHCRCGLSALVTVNGVKFLRGYVVVAENTCEDNAAP